MPLPTRSLSTPITLTSVAVCLSIALLVGWTLLVVETLSNGRTWLLVLGIVSIVFITTVLLLSGIALAREILMGRQHRQFIDSVTHELKSPLASLALCLDALDHPSLSPEQGLEVRAIMRQDTTRLARFIDDVLVASRLAQDNFVTSEAKRTVELKLMLERLWSTIAREQAQTLTFQLSVPEDLTLHTFGPALDIILRNLLDNAVKYSPSEGAVYVSALSDAKQCIIHVRDEGIGLKTSDQKAIFRRFYRVDSSEVRARSGSGLGLHVAQTLARQLGGHLSVSSPGLGQGSTFTLTLPIS